jgi:chain length determinant protein EpsF
MTLRQITDIVKARYKIAAAFFVAILVVVLAATFLLPAKYTASAAVVIDAKSPDPLNGMTLQSSLLPGYLATQTDIIKSERVVLKVIRDLGLAQNEPMRAQWQDATNGAGSFESWLSGLLVRNLDIVPSRDSSVINIEYTAADPRFASAMANAFVKAYMDVTLELRVEPAKRFTALFNEQAKQSRDALEKAQNRLSEYQRAKGIIATDERLDVETARLNELSNQLVVLQAITAESSSRKANAGANAAEVLNNPVVAGLKADLSRLEARLKETAAVFGSAHPNVAQLQANINELKLRIDAEVSRVQTSIGITNNVNVSRESQIKRALEDQRKKVLELKQQRDEASVLLTDVANAQRAYELLQARYAQTSLESQSNQTNVSLLKVATPPAEPSSPKTALNLVVGLLLSGMVAVGVALLMESVDKRVRHVEDLSDLPGGLLGSAPLASFNGTSKQEVNKFARLPSAAFPRLMNSPKA